MWRGYWRFLLPYRTGCLHEPALTIARSRARKRFTSSIRREEQHRVLDAILHFFHALFDPDGLRELIRAGGAPLICTIVFIETGLFVGFFLPGDSLLVTAGILSAGGVIPLRWLLLGVRPVRRARYVPSVRPLCPPVSGAARMPYTRYLIFDIFGGIFWVGTMILGSYSLGHLIPNIAQRIHYVIAVVILLSILPVIVSLLRARGAAAAPTAEEK